MSDSLDVSGLFGYGAPQPASPKPTVNGDPDTILSTSNLHHFGYRRDFATRMATSGAARGPGSHLRLVVSNTSEPGRP